MDSPDAIAATAAAQSRIGVGHRFPRLSTSLNFWLASALRIR
jgi:hypothetical protein